MTIQDLAFSITAAFEGGSYSAINTFDQGIVSFGRWQFTLASGSQGRLLNSYISSGGSFSLPLTGYQDRINRKDASLKNDAQFLALLRQSATDPLMQSAQDALAWSLYYQPMMEKTITPRKLILPLSICWAFDTAINAGPNQLFIAKAEEDMGLPNHSTVVDRVQKGISEQKLMSLAIHRRSNALNAQAARDNLPGLTVRAQFWTNRVLAQDWNLYGNDGILTVKRGVTVRGNVTGR